jgi:hypothetical protein
VYRLCQAAQKHVQIWQKVKKRVKKKQVNGEGTRGERSEGAHSTRSRLVYAVYVLVLQRKKYE